MGPKGNRGRRKRAAGLGGGAGCLTSILSILSFSVLTASSSSWTMVEESQGRSPMVSLRAPPQREALSWKLSSRPLSHWLSLPDSSRMVSWSRRIWSFCCSAVCLSCSAVLCRKKRSSAPGKGASPCGGLSEGHSTASGVHRNRLKSCGCWWCRWEWWGRAPGGRSSSESPGEPPPSAASPAPWRAPGPLPAAGPGSRAAAAAALESLSAPWRAPPALAVGWMLAMMQMMAPRNASIPAASSTARNFRVAAAGARAGRNCPAWARGGLALPAAQPQRQRAGGGGWCTGSPGGATGFWLPLASCRRCLYAGRGARHQPSLTLSAPHPLPGDGEQHAAASPSHLSWCPPAPRALNTCSKDGRVRVLGPACYTRRATDRAVAQ